MLSRKPRKALSDGSAQGVVAASSTTYGRSWTVTRGRVVNLEEKLEKPTVAELGGIEDNLDGFGVTSMIAVGRIRNVSRRVWKSRRHIGESSLACPRSSHQPERHVLQSLDILHLTEVSAIAFSLHIVAVDEPQ
jgi:hypothetical protein